MIKMKRYISNKFFLIFFMVFSQDLGAEQMRYVVNFPFSVEELRLDFGDLDVNVQIEKMRFLPKDEYGRDVCVRISMEMDEIQPFAIESFFTHTHVEKQGVERGEPVFQSTFSGVNSRYVNTKKVVHVTIKAPTDLVSTIYAKKARVSSVDMKYFPSVRAEDSFVSSADTKNAVGIFQSTQHIDLYDPLSRLLKKKKMPLKREKEIFSVVVKSFIRSLGDAIYKPFHMIKDVALFLAEKNPQLEGIQKKISSMMDKIGSGRDYLHENALNNAIEKSAKKHLQAMVLSEEKERRGYKKKALGQKEER